MVQEKSTEQVEKYPVWTFFIIIALGFWLLTAPGAFQFKSQPLIWSDIISGIALIVLGLACRRHPKQIWLWIIAFIGIWIQFAPLLFWAPDSAAFLTNVLIGSLVITFSVVLFQLPGELPNVEPTVPAGWTYNPSSAPQRLPVAILVFICWTISRYLACYQLGYIDTVWDPFFVPGTKAVVESTISHEFPVPDAGLGALAYTVEFFTVLQGGRARWRTAPWLVLVYGVLVIPVGLISTTLVILQPLAVGTWCTLCLVTAVCMLFAIPLAIDEVIASLQYLNKNGWHLLFKGGECAEATNDETTPSMDSSIWTLFKASFWGMGFPWNLWLAAFLGIFLMATPALFGAHGLLFDFDPILGAFSTVVAVVSFTERLRGFRWAIGVFAIALLIIAWSTGQGMTIHTPIAIVLALLCIRKGHMKHLQKS